MTHTLTDPDCPPSVRDQINGGVTQEAVDHVCHDEQMTVWTGELAGRLSIEGYLREDLAYDDVLGVHSCLGEELKRVIESAFSHPELAATPSQSGSR